MIISRQHVLSQGSIVDAPQLSNEFNNILNAINGNIDQTNISVSACPTVTKLFLGATGDVLLNRTATKELTVSDKDGNALNTVNVKAGAAVFSCEPNVIIHATHRRALVVGANNFKVNNEASDRAVVYFDGVTALAVGAVNHIAFAEVHLPNGAKVVSVELVGTTASGAGNIVNIQLVKYSRGTAYWVMATATITDGDTEDTDTSISEDTINNYSSSSAQYYYGIEAYIQASGSTANAKLRNVGILYDVTNLG